MISPVLATAISSWGVVQSFAHLATKSRGNNSKTCLRRFNPQPTKVGFAVVGAISNRQPTGNAKT